MSAKELDYQNAWDNSKKHVDQPERVEPQTSINIGSYNHLNVQSRSDFGMYLNLREDRVLLPNKYVPEDLMIGGAIDVFVYTDSEDRLVATTLAPAGVVGDFVFLEAKDVASFGTFMDWGLEKDLLVPKMEQQDRMEPGEKYLTKICLDESTQRVYGTTKISANCEKETKNLEAGQQVDLIIHSITTIGITAVIDNQYYGMLYLNETYRDLSVGEQCKGYVMRVRDDNKVDLTLKKPGFASVEGSAKEIVELLEKAGGFIPCHDKSSPDEIRKVFSMSKKEFKRAIGGLYKKGILNLKKNGIELKK